MKAKRLIFSIFVSILTAFSGGQQAIADDSDIYTQPPLFTSDARPKVLIIFDTSGSMDEDVTTAKPSYDPSIDYTALAGAPAGVTRDRVYWDRPNGSGIYDASDALSNDRWFNKSALKCQKALDEFDKDGLPATTTGFNPDSNGYYGEYMDFGLILRHDNATDKDWERLEAGGAYRDQYVDCYADRDPSNSDKQVDTGDYLRNNDNDGYTNSSAQEINWSGYNSNRDNKPRLYSGNYIAYWENTSLTAIRSRINIAKESMREVIDDNPSVDFGLMVFNQNNSTPHGGRVIMANGDPEQEITALDTTLRTAMSGGDTVITLDDSQRFSVGDNIGVKLNSGTIAWTTVTAAPETKIQLACTSPCANGASTITVEDATGFAAGDPIGVQLQDDSIDWDTVSSVSGNDITLSGSLGQRTFHNNMVFHREVTLASALGAASAGNEVYVKKERRERLKDVIGGLIADGWTPLAESLYEGYLYMAGENVHYGGTNGSTNPPADPCAEDPANCATGTPTRGTYSSPLTYQCEKAYIIMMTDGDPYGDDNGGVDALVQALPAQPAASGESVTAGSGTVGGGEGEALVPMARWFHRNDVNTNLGQTQGGMFYAVTFGTGLSGGAQTRLDDATKAGTGDTNAVATNATDVQDLKDAFQTILSDIKIESASFAAPSLSVNAFNKLYNRDEIYFALFEPGRTAKWNGNLKKFHLCNNDDVTNYGCTYGEIVDAAFSPAIDNTTGRIKASSNSYWNTGADGGTVTSGGSGEITRTLDPDADRRLYTWLGTYSSATFPLTLTQVDDASGNALFDAADPSAATPGNPATLGLPGTAVTADVTNLVGWMMGKDTFDEDGDASTTLRWPMSDPLHSRPVAITYGAHVSGGSPDYDQPIVKLAVAGNDGAIRMYNDSNGKEEWSFIPQEMLAYQHDLSGTDATDHIYGVDNTVTVWVVDNNNNGIIEPGGTDNDKVYLYASMRRGAGNGAANNIYAFDLTPATKITDKSAIDVITPKLLWVIEGGTGKFKMLGQTWSAPQVETVRINTGGTGSVERTALLFGGGYSTAVENTTSPTVENKAVTPNNASKSGAIFMVDALTGERLWWASSTTATDGQATPVGADLQLTDMVYPIPSDMSLLDNNGDNAIDRIYVGDVGGQVWRIDLDPEIKPSGSNQSQRNGNTSGYVFADLVCDRASTSPYARSCPATPDPQEWRRVFYAPDVAAVTDTTYISGGESERLYDMVFVSTGDRPDPLDRLTSEGLSPTEHPVHNAVYGLKEPNYTFGTVASPPRPITPHGATSDVHDATANLVENGTTAEQTTAANELRDRKGWMVSFKESSNPAWTATDDIGLAEGGGRPWIGEKSLARPVIFGGVVYVTTFTPANPGTTTATCEPNEGQGKIYGLNYLDAKIAIDLDGDGTKERSIGLGGGIPSELVTVIREDGTTGLVGSSGGAVKVEVENIGGQERTFWYQE